MMILQRLFFSHSIARETTDWAIKGVYPRQLPMMHMPLMYIVRRFVTAHEMIGETIFYHSK